MREWAEWGKFFTEQSFARIVYCMLLGYLKSIEILIRHFHFTVLQRMSFEQ